MAQIVNRDEAGPGRGDAGPNGPTLDFSRPAAATPKRPSVERWDPSGPTLDFGSSKTATPKRPSIERWDPSGPTLDFGNPWVGMQLRPPLERWDPEAPTLDFGDPWAAEPTPPPPPVERAGGWLKRWPLILVPVWAALAAVNIVVFGLGTRAPEAAARTTTAPRVTATVPASSASTPPSTPSPSVQATVTPEVLAPVGVIAYGPTGPGSGDDSSRAVDVIDASAGSPWQTDWYRTAAFGNLQAGTGLLIDMGRPVTITSVRIILGSTPGTDLELLTGNAPAQSQMLIQASASDAGGSITLHVAHPKSARYLLIWLTRLPPDSAGTFQAAVYNVRLDGTP